MTETLSSIFQRTQGAPAEVAGRLVHPIFKKNIKVGRNDFFVRRLRMASPPISGLRLKVLKGKIEVNGQSHSEVILWSDTSPESFSFSIVAKAKCQLKVWNVWRVAGMVQAWVGNAGIVITEEDSGTKLECSGGTEVLDFSTLIVQIKSIN